jgi:UDP-N-acetyl-D-mannosaminuronic acid transferase (WecB/TagA/CpsF family)
MLKYSKTKNFFIRVIMSEKEKKLRAGDAKIEFFSNFDYIKEKYYDGIVVATKLFELTKKEKKISMKYVQFNKYFQEHIYKKDERFFSFGDKQKIKTESIEKIETNEELKVKKIIVGGDKSKKSFNPHTIKIDEKDIL